MAEERGECGGEVSEEREGGRADWYPDDAIVSAAANTLHVCRMPAYDPSVFSNPALNKFYSHLQAHSLEQEKPDYDENEMDGTQPTRQLKAMLEKKQKKFDAFADALAHIPEEDARAASKKGGKRAGVAGGGGGGAAKRAKSAATPEEAGALPWAQMMRDKTLSNQTNGTLKLYCELHGLAKSGRKEQLVERISDHLYSVLTVEAEEAGGAGGGAVKVKKEEEKWLGGEKTRAARPRQGGPSAATTLNHHDFKRRQQEAAEAAALPLPPTPTSPLVSASQAAPPPKPSREPWMMTDSDSD